LIGPILLVVIGGLFLLNNLKPETPLVELMARYWPFLLIGWGALRLVEILYWAIRSQPLPRKGVSGGEWALIILICIIGSGVRVASSHWPPARITMHGIDVFGEAYDFQLEALEPAGKTPRILVENLRGNVRIVGTDSEEVKVEGRTTVRAFDYSNAEEANEQCPLEVLTQGDQIVVRTNHDRLKGPEKISADLEIAVPKGAAVKGRSRHGDFDISRVDGDVELESDDASVRLTDIGGSARIDLKGSDIVRVVNLKGALGLEGRGRDVELENIESPVTLRGSYSGELLFRNLAKPLHFESGRTEMRVERTPGQIRMALGEMTASNLEGPIELRTHSRDVRITDFTEHLVISIDRGDVELRPGKSPLARMEVTLASGDVDLALPESATFGLTATARRGEVVNNFGPALQQQTQGSGATLKGPEGQEPSITLSTGRGTVVVRKASGTAAPPKSPAPPAPPKLEQH